MSNRLDKERESELQPRRMQFALDELKKLGYQTEFDHTKIEFSHNGNKIQFFPYSGWHTGKGIIDGRGWKNLKKQLTNESK